MDTSKIAIVLTLIAFPVALFAVAKTLYHMWFVVAGVRHDKIITASLLGPFCLFVPSLFEHKAQEHLRRLNPWLLVTAVSFVILFTLKTIAEY